MAVTAGLICVLFSAVGGQPAGVRVSLSLSVDTTDVDRRAVFELWLDYLNSRPGEMWRDPDWNAAKSRLWRDFDLTAPYVYPSSTDSVTGRYRPIVIAIDEEENRYSIRTLFYEEGLEPPEDTRNPWAIVRVYAQREGGAWKLRNALGVHTERWHRPAIGMITFVSSPVHEFDVALALRSVAFCDSICEVFDFFDWGPFDFYVTDSREDVSRILGLEYHLFGFGSGLVMRSQDILITGSGREWDPYGLARMVATGPGIDPHPIVPRGFAAWVGGWNGRSYEDNMVDVAAFLAANSVVSFDDYVARGREYGMEGIPFFPGAVLCDMVFEASGAGGIEALFKSGGTAEDLYAAIESTLGLGRVAFQRTWRQKVLDFRK